MEAAGLWNSQPQPQGLLQLLPESLPELQTPGNLERQRAVRNECCLRQAAARPRPAQGACRVRHSLTDQIAVGTQQLLQISYQMIHFRLLDSDAETLSPISARVAEICEQTSGRV